MKDNELITRKNIELALLNKGQHSRRYKLGNIWELNYDEIREVLDDVDTDVQPVRWIPVTEKLPEEDHWLGGSGRQFSDEVLVSVANYDDDDIWTYISQTIDGEWALELPSHCKIIAWMPLPAPWKGEKDD